MQPIRNAIEKRFQAAGLWLYRNPRKSLLVILALVVFLGLQIPSITIDTSSEALLHKEDPSLLRYNAFRDQFGRAELIIIAVDAPEIFNTTCLTRLKAFHEDLENEVPYLREVTSLINVRQTRGKGDELIVQDLLAEWPEKAIDLDQLRTMVMQTPFYPNYIVSKDGRITAVIIETEASLQGTESHEDPLAGFEEEDPAQAGGSPDKRYFSEKENREVVETISRLVAKHTRERFSLEPGRWTCHCLRFQSGHPGGCRAMHRIDPFSGCPVPGDTFPKTVRHSAAHHRHRHHAALHHGCHGASQHPHQNHHHHYSGVSTLSGRMRLGPYPGYLLPRACKG